MQALALAAAIRTGCKAWSSRAAATRFGYVLHAFHQLLALILLSSAFLPDVRTRLRSAPSPPAFGRPSHRLRPHLPPFADAPPTGCDHTSHRMRPLGSDPHRALPLLDALPIDCGRTSHRLRTLLLPVVTTLPTECGHSAQICTAPYRLRTPFQSIATTLPAYSATRLKSVPCQSTRIRLTQICTPFAVQI